jgi:ketosteroid isomerase-like protein
MAERHDTEGFRVLFQRLAAAWAAQQTEDALACFTEDAEYMQPPDVQFYAGHDQLRAYFGALRPGTFLRIEHLWFDAALQMGCVEFSFGKAGRPEADHGCIVVQLRDGKIAHWREYVQRGPADFDAFISTRGKAWQWHIGNYP